ncbi:Phosphatidylinositol 3,4,5-trisphosphate 3-phosphatase and protein-tyrosine-phosphatase PTEN1 [Vitis vinifera]|uniref:Phosphatidylinositol 3,4,5-trisphosphate 3-phosphatase and protein-tyrosine-phosphatase PTEN1 n=1 Tax=Vitis vinifera TaxID=29760 RepID=A0A438H972_VITVI|nr:Phosphatidylinositol 3,4,5-trisphosphate 3-phosphatase and protein-tyrosine-phosphatase PTEN1 [Vitis vinifera]
MSAEEALKLYADKRTTNNKGVSHTRCQFQANAVMWGTGKVYLLSTRGAVFFMVSELQEELLQTIKKGYQRTNNPRYYLSFGDNDQQGMKSEQGERCVVVQMDTESPVLYQKACLDYNFDKPLKVTGDVRIIFYQKSMGGRLFYTCFNTAFIRNSLLQFTVSNLDKMGHKGKSICGPAFGLELLFGPANAEHSFQPTLDDDDLL